MYAEELSVTYLHLERRLYEYVCSLFHRATIKVTIATAHQLEHLVYHIRIIHIACR